MAANNNRYLDIYYDMTGLNYEDVVALLTTIVNEELYLKKEVYILLLFEIARRQVPHSDESTDKKKRFDALSIESAIMNIVKLLKAKKCTFKDVFLKEGKYHCFSHEPKDSEKAIKKIVDAVIILEEKCQGQGVY
ncbi:hypothetical protein OS493_002673 [Desmophyllum pertusum]|uniref:Uncharacterized protein n=1 Tax=Desmophyllum pertusum TaxID=174260 RepID=A0A9X0CMD9_9CNID|nr:hypothetical protein OS493_002673 [Desmophyllum pertusum]